MSRRRHSIERPSERSRSMWFSTMSRLQLNQKAESPVRTRPLSGISVGRTTSKVEMRSLATSSRRSSSSAYSSRTLPLPTCVPASGMEGLLSSRQGVQALEDNVDVTGVGTEVEDLLQRGAVEGRGDLRVGADELGEVLLLLPCAQRGPLHELVRMCALQPALDQGEQQSLAEEEAVACFEVPSHALGPDDELGRKPREAVEHVVERQEGVRNHDALGRGVGDVALVPERDVLEADDRSRAHDAGESADPLGHDRVFLVRHRGRALLPAAERLFDLPDLGSREVPDLERELLERRGSHGECGQ